MKYSVDKQDKYLLIQLNETKVDSTVSPQLKSDFVTLNAEGNKNIILDMSQVKYIDSSGLSAILVGNRMATDSDGIFILTGITDHVMKLIKISQLDSVLDIMPTVQEAVDAVYLNELGSDLDQENSL
jgi:anti-anti-sigma factor